MYEFACCLCVDALDSSQCPLFSLAAVCGFCCDFFSSAYDQHTDPYLRLANDGRRTDRPNFFALQELKHFKKNKASTVIQHKGGGPYRVRFADLWVAELGDILGALLPIDRSPVLGFLSRPSKDLTYYWEVWGESPVGGTSVQGTHCSRRHIF